jgi:hypothetical protein
MAEPFNWHAAWQGQKKQWHQLTPCIPMLASAVAWLCGETLVAQWLQALVWGMLLQNWCVDRCRRQGQRDTHKATPRPRDVA